MKKASIILMCIQFIGVLSVFSQIIIPINNINKGDFITDYLVSDSSGYLLIELSSIDIETSRVIILSIENDSIVSDFTINEMLFLYKSYFRDNPKYCLLFTMSKHWWLRDRLYKVSYGDDINSIPILVKRKNISLIKKYENPQYIWRDIDEEFTMPIANNYKYRLVNRGIEKTVIE